MNDLSFRRPAGVAAAAVLAVAALLLALLVPARSAQAVVSGCSKVSTTGTLTVYYYRTNQTGTSPIGYTVWLTSGSSSSGSTYSQQFTKTLSGSQPIVVEGGLTIRVTSGPANNTITVNSGLHVDNRLSDLGSTQNSAYRTDSIPVGSSKAINITAQAADDLGGTTHQDWASANFMVYTSYVPDSERMRCK